MKKIIAMLLLAVIIAGCKKDKKSDPVPPTPTTIVFKNNSSLSLDITIYCCNGDKILESAGASLDKGASSVERVWNHSKARIYTVFGLGTYVYTDIWTVTPAIKNTFYITDDNTVTLDTPCISGSKSPCIKIRDLIK